MDLEKYENIKDEELVSCVLDDPECYSVLIKRYEDKLKRYIQRITNISNDDAEDLLQDVFISAYENLNSFNQDLSFSSWIYRISHNKTVNNWKKGKKTEGDISVEANLFLVESFFNENSIELEIDQKAVTENIEKIFARMDEKYRQVLILKFVEDKDYKEISDILQKPMGSIATLINRGKKSFIKEFEEIKILEEPPEIFGEYKQEEEEYIEEKYKKE